MLVPDGAYAFPHDRARFHRAPAPADNELACLLDTLIGRITRTLVRAGMLVEDPQYPWLDIHSDSGGDSALEQLVSAAVRYRIAVGPIAGRKTTTLHSPGAVSGERAPAKVLTAARDGFSLNAAVACESHQRDNLERLCRHVSRGPIALERLSIDGDGLVVHELKHPFRSPNPCIDELDAASTPGIRYRFEELSSLWRTSEGRRSCASMRPRH